VGREPAKLKREPARADHSRDERLGVAVLPGRGAGVVVKVSFDLPAA
jgi:hypothetical protein